jgi:hypothetical protein
VGKWSQRWTKECPWPTLGHAQWISAGRTWKLPAWSACGLLPRRAIAAYAFPIKEGMEWEGSLIIEILLISYKKRNLTCPQLRRLTADCTCQLQCR